MIHRTPNEICYQAIALRDISVGEEVTCDYALFDYHCNGHEIEECACGSPKCRGRMLGFQGLSLQAKVEILHLVEEEIKDKFLQEENVVILQSFIPHGIDLVSGESGTHLIATKGFGIGEPLFTNRAELVSIDDLAEKKYVLDIGGLFFLVETEHHVIFRDGFAEILGKTTSTS
jgi:hypothetical protein